MSNPKRSVGDWIQAAEHEPLCPSGFRPKIRIPDLAALIESGEIPQHLLEVAIGVATGDTKPSVDLVKQQREFTDKLVQHMVVEPTLDAETVAQIPFEDKDFLVALARASATSTRRASTSPGLSKSEKFRRFRRLGEFDEDVEGL
jgi:hypothetical protein